MGRAVDRVGVQHSARHQTRQTPHNNAWEILFFNDFINKKFKTIGVIDLVNFYSFNSMFDLKDNNKFAKLKLNNFSSELFNDIPSNAYLYFVNSYFVEISTSYTIATSVYGQPFSAAIKKDNFYGTQFHPEKSGRIGKKILENFLSI